MTRQDLHPVYVWQWPVRLIHWTMVLALPVLAFTGFYIASPFISGKFVMGWMRQIHLFAAYAFLIAVFARIVWMFTGNEYAKWSQIVPSTRERLRGIFSMARFYAWPAREPPHHVGHNPLAGLTYLAFYGLAFFIIATGLGLHAVNAGPPLSWFGFLTTLFGGAQMTRLIHHILMWAAFFFVAAHVYVVVFIARIEKNAIIDGMITGWKLTRRGKHG
jgi:Ni/Fe-hydrogenase 1 B-type cytochrome subunit